MGAKLEIALCINLMKDEDDAFVTFVAFDEVKLKLKNGKTVKGTLLPMENTRCCQINTEKRRTDHLSRGHRGLYSGIVILAR